MSIVNSYSLIFKQRVVNAYINYNQSSYYIALLFGISRSSLFNWVKLHKDGKLIEKQTYVKKKVKITSTIISNFLFICFP